MSTLKLLLPSPVLVDCPDPSSSHSHDILQLSTVTTEREGQREGRREEAVEKEVGKGKKGIGREKEERKNWRLAESMSLQDERAIYKQATMLVT